MISRTGRTPDRRVKKEKPQLKESIYSLRPDELQQWFKENGEKAIPCWANL